MERTQPQQINTTLLHWYEFLYHINYLRGIEDLLYSGVFNHGVKILGKEQISDKYRKSVEKG
jgi:hypothetical protein